MLCFWLPSISVLLLILQESKSREALCTRQLKIVVSWPGYHKNFSTQVCCAAQMQFYSLLKLSRACLSYAQEHGAEIQKISETWWDLTQNFYYLDSGLVYRHIAIKIPLCKVCHFTVPWDWLDWLESVLVQVLCNAPCTILWNKYVLGTRLQ